ncbi:MAG: hypothetical protein WD186_00620, partial [Actinomycetota bacterium]
MQTPTKGPQDHLPAEPRAPLSPAASRPARFEQDLLVIPEAVVPRRWGLIAAVIAVVVALTLVIALIAYAVDQRHRAGELDTQLATALDDQSALLADAAASRAGISSLESRLAVLQGDLQRARQGKSVLAASRQE